MEDWKKMGIIILVIGSTDLNSKPVNLLMLKMKGENGNENKKLIPTLF